MSVVVVSEPPSSVQSGVTLQNRYTIQHKSDTLLQEQVDAVRKTQDQLEKLITELQITKNKKEVTRIHSKLEQLRKQAEYEVLKLQVANKISAELAHNRGDLERALGGRGDIPACRKRVSWLEERMEKVLGKQRLRNRRPQVSSPITMKPKVAMIQRQTKEQDTIQVPVEGNELVSHSKDRLADVSVSAVSSQTADDQDSVELQSSTVDTGEIENLYTESPKQQASNKLPDKDVGPPPQSQNEFPSDSERGTRLSISAPAGRISQMDENGVNDDSKPGYERTVESYSYIEDQLSDGQTEQYKTADSQLALIQSEKSGSAITEKTTAMDAATEYWQSEHHRFESNDISQALCDADPLSYHQMPLAVPGSFLSRSQSDISALPWRPHRKGSDIQDVHKIALNKLLTRLNQMSEKVYNAAMLSVRSQKNLTQKPEISFAQSYDAASRHSGEGIKPLEESAGQNSDVSIVLPKVPKKRLQVSESGRVVFQPSPIPPPQKLPLTRTNFQLEFPRLSSYYCDVTDDKRKPAERIVDQHNLYEETKFSLYREKPKGILSGPSITERRLRQMLQSDSTRTTTTSAKTLTSSKDSALTSATSISPMELSKRRRRKLKSHFAVAKAVAKLKGPNRWNLLKPKGSGTDHSGMKWERVKTLVHINLVSDRVDERIDAARHLGLLKCSDAMVFFALKERVQKDEDQRVQYEAAKSLVLFGCWDDDVLEVILQYLLVGNTEIRSDLISTMGEGKNLQFIDKSTASFPELVKVLSHFCRNPNPEDMIAFDAAVLLGRMCVSDKYAKARLKSVLHNNNNTHHKAKALEIIIKQMCCTDWDVVEELLELLNVSPVWKYRDLATKLLILIGSEEVNTEEKTDQVYSLLEKKLWDDPMMDVRLSVAKAITALNMFPRACDRVEKRLEDKDENTRAQAVISLGTLGMKSEKIIRQLLEMIELDSSEYVRIMIVRTFITLSWTDKRIIRVLREKERSEGVLAVESKKALTVLLDTAGKSKSTKSW